MEIGTALEGIIEMAYPVIIDKYTLFKYPTNPKLAPTRDAILLDIKSETEFENYVTRTTPDTNIETILSCTSLHLPPCLLATIALHMESEIKILFKATLDAATTKYHPVSATAPVATTPLNPIQIIKVSHDYVTASATATSYQSSYTMNNVPTPNSTGNPNPNINQNIGQLSNPSPTEDAVNDVLPFIQLLLLA